jgi:DNA-binding response OmpR family regulator
MKVLGLAGDGINDRHIETLCEAGFQLNICDSLFGLNQAITDITDYDCILLNFDRFDEGLMQTISSIRIKEIDTPILVLTNTSNTDNIVRTLDNGADDVTHLSVDPLELLARIKALHRRRKINRSCNIKVGAIDYDKKNYCAFQNGKLLNFSAQESHMLGLLVERSSRPIAKLELQKMMNGFGYKVSSNALEVAIHRLRNKLKLVDLKIETIRGFGYRLQNPNRQVQ